MIEGETASFPCKYAGLSYDPIWVINSTFYQKTNVPCIPVQHIVREQNGTMILNVINVQRAINSTTYQCVVFNRHNYIYSNKAYLYIGKYIKNNLRLKSVSF